jgi:hypothetical protein
VAAITDQTRVFDRMERTDRRPAGFDEPWFDFLNRVDTPYWQRVRNLMDGWFRHLPEDAQGDVRGRFRSSDNGQHIGALWEMYLHESLLIEGFTLTPHLEMPTGRRIDFLAQRRELSMYVEATVSLPSREATGADRRIAQVTEAMNSVRSPNFFLWLGHYNEGGASPSVRRLRHDLEAWLETLDPDSVAVDLASTSGLALDAMPTYRWRREGWDIEFRAMPIKADARGMSGHRPVGVSGPARAAYIDATGPLRSSLVDKATCYGDMDRPYLIAVACEAVISTDDFDIEGALFGQAAMTFDRVTLEATPIRHPDGLWTSAPRANNGVSGVLVARNIRAWTVAEAEPSLWHNPWANHPLPNGLPWASAQVEPIGGSIARADPSQPVHQRLGLKPGWPGPGDPFPDYTRADRHN